MSKFIEKKNYFAYVMALLYLGVIIFCVVFQFSPFLWFDESGQFWISQGLNHDSAPLSSIGDIFDVIENNKFYNLDPGGFGVILHFWLKLGTNYVWMRILPLLFFIGAVFCLGHLLYRWTKNLDVSLLMCFVLLLSDTIYPMAFEIRAYSMELLGVMLTIEMLEYIKQGCQVKSLLIWSIILSFFMTSRYSFAIVAFIASICVLYLVIRNDENYKLKIVKLTIYALPLICSLCYIYFFAMRFQNPDVLALGYLPYLSENPNQLKWDDNFKYILLIVFLTYLWICSYKNKYLSKYSILLYMVVGVNISFIILSLLGMHPWAIDSTRCISMISLVIVTLTAFLAELINVIDEKINVKWVVLLVFVLYFGNSYRKAFKPKQNLYTFLQEVEFDEKSVYSDRWASPSIRYLIEYGELKNHVPSYPNSFRFATGEKHCQNKEKRLTRKEWYQETQPDLDELINYDILIIPELYEYSKYDSIAWESAKEKILIYKNYL